MAILRTGQIKPNPIDWILALNPFICAMLAFGSLTFAPIQPKNHLFSANLEKWAKIKAQQNHDNNDESRTNSRKKRINDEHQSRLSPSARSNAKYAENLCPFLKKYYSKPFSRSASYAKFQAMTLFPNDTAEIDDIFLKQKKKTKYSIEFSGENAIVSIGCGSLNQMLSHHLLSHFIYLMGHLCVRRKSQPKKIYNGTWLYAFVIYFFFGFVRAF